jgi:tetratricopeptide (TPR) repeat protein
MRDMHPTNEILNDYVDGALGAGDHAGVEEHLQACADCALLVAELQHIIAIAEAASLRPLAPPAHVWTQIEARLSSAADPTGQRVERSGRHAWRSTPARALATAAALILATFIGVRYAAVTGHPAQPLDKAADVALVVESELREAEGHYQKAISGLQQIADAGQGTLDPATAATLQKNLAVIDQAIDESRAALQANPGSVSAQASLLEGLKAKLTLLEDTVGLINELRPRSRG